MHKRVIGVTREKVGLVVIVVALTAVMSSYDVPAQSRWVSRIAGAVAVAQPALVNASPPALPKPLSLPAQPIVAASSNGYLPSSWDVTPTGEFTYAIPLTVPAGRASMQPELTLNYSSGGGNGLLGVGWSVTGVSSSITRCGRSLNIEGHTDGVDFSSADRFCLDGQKLVAVGSIANGTGAYGDIGTQYRTVPESFAQILSTGAKTADGKGPEQFIVYTKDGRKRTYTAVEAQRLAPTLDGQVNPVGSVRVEWLLASDEDRLGNAITYEYCITQGTTPCNPKSAGPGPGPGPADYALEILPYRIHYTSNTVEKDPAYRYVQFTYEDRKDKSGQADYEFSWQSGIEHVLRQRVKTIDMYAPNPTSIQQVWGYTFNYTLSTGSHRSLLASVQQCSTVGGCAWKKTFVWTPSTLAPQWVENGPTQPQPIPAPLNGVPHDPAVAWEEPAMQVMDLDGDGADDLLYHPGSTYFDFTVPNQVVLSSTATGVMVPLSNGPIAIDRTEAGAATDYGNVRVGMSYPVNVDGGKQVQLWAAHFEQGVYGQFPDNCDWRLERWNGKGFTRGTGLPCELVDITSNPVKYDYPKVTFADLDGDGLPDLLHSGSVIALTNDPTETYKPVWFVSFNHDNKVAGAFGLRQNTGADGHCSGRVTDVDGDGRGDFLTVGGTLTNGVYHCAAAGFAVTTDDTGSVHVQGSAEAFPALAEGESIRFGDFNGDGLEDYLVLPQVLPDTLTGGRDNSNAPSHIFWNTGNGYYADPTPVWIPVDVHPDQANGVDTKFADKGIRLVDINHDGRMDIVSFHNNPAQNANNAAQNSPGQTITLLLSNGDGTFQQVDIPMAQPGTRLDTKSIQWANAGALFGVWPDYTGQFAGVAPGWNLAQVGDLNGDGFPDLIYHAGGAAGAFEIKQQVPQMGDRLINTFDEPTPWPAQEIAYSTEWSDAPAHKTDDSCDYPLTCLRRGLIVVRSVTSRTNLVDPAIPSAGGHTTQYAYRDPVSDSRGDGFLGFGQVTVWDPSIPQQTVTTYDQRTRVDVTDNPNNPVDGTGSYYPYAGIPKTVTTVVPVLTEADGKPATAKARVSMTVTEDIELRRLNKNRTYAVFTKKSYTKEWDEKSLALTWTLPVNPQSPSNLHIALPAEPAVALRRVDVNANFDDYGNVTSQVQWTTGGVSRWVDTQYQNDEDTWLIGLPISQKVTEAASTGNQPQVERHVDYGYDVGPGQPNLGQLKTVSVEQGGADALASTTTLQYDNYGQLISSTSSVANETPRTGHIEYAPLYPGAPDERIYPSQVWAEHTNPACAVDCRPSQWFVVHPAYGVPVAAMDINGVQTTITHDGLGRVVGAHSDGEQAVAMSYSGRPDAFGPGVLNGMLVTATVGLQQFSIVETDARGNTLSTANTGFDGTLIHTKMSYDLLGRLISATRPYQSVSTGITVNSYDSLDRLLKTVFPDKSQVVHGYPSMFESHTWDASNNESYVVTDVDGRVAVSANVLVTPNYSAAVKTSYQYAPFGLVNTVTDDAGHVTQIGYDTLGRRITLDDPDRGKMTTSYNGFGEVLQANSLAMAGQTQTYAHDDLGRVLSQTTADGTATYQWDTAANGVGQLAQTTSADQIMTSYSYDGLGRLAESVLHDELNTPYSMDVTYDSSGRLDTLTYPPVPGRQRLTTKYHYNPSDFLDEIGDATPLQPYQPLWQVTTRNADMALIDGNLGNGAIAVHRDYDALMGRLSNQKATHAGTNLLSVGYQYHPNGLVKERLSDNGAMQRDETFAYDSLYRLTQWGLNYRTSPGPVGGISPQPGVYTTAPPTAYQYDTLGNLTDILKNNAVTEHRTYGKPDGSQPHTLTDNYNPANKVHTASVYDAMGRMNQDPNRSIGYTAFDLPKTLTNTGQSWTLLYDAQGQRIKKTGKDGTTLYVPGLYERRQAGASIQHVFHIEGTDGAVAQVTYDEPTTTTTVRYPLSDALGSVGVVADINGATSDLRYYDPFGQSINADGTVSAATGSTVKEGFTGQENDDAFNLINFRGRMYDPALKRFLTPDPHVAHPGFSQSWNHYSYVMNSPLNFTDPSGFDDVDCHDGLVQKTDGGTVTSSCGSSKGQGNRQAAADFKKSVRSQEMQQARKEMHRDGLAVMRQFFSGPAPVAKVDPTGRQEANPGDGGAGGAHGYVTPGLTGAGGRHDGQGGAGSESLNGAGGGDAYAIARQRKHNQQQTDILSQIPILGLLCVASCDDPNLPGAIISSVPVFGEVLPAVDSAGAAGAALGNCFVAGTLIQTPDGVRPIESIQVGDRVIARDENTGETTYKPVVRLFKHKDQEIVYVTLTDEQGNEETMGATLEHPFHVRGRGWVGASALQAGDRVDRLSEGSLNVRQVRRDEQRQATYNFEVAEIHSYFVGKEGAWVHNASIQDVFPKIRAARAKIGMAERAYNVIRSNFKEVLEAINFQRARVNRLSALLRLSEESAHPKIVSGLVDQVQESLKLQAGLDEERELLFDEAKQARETRWGANDDLKQEIKSVTTPANDQ